MRTRPPAGMSEEGVFAALAVMRALSALKLKRSSLKSTSEGIEIRQPGKPTLLLTDAAVNEFSREVDEAEHD